MYLDQWSPPKEESKQIGRDVITDHYWDRDNEPAEENFHSIRKTGGKFSSLRKSDQSRMWMGNVCEILKIFTLTMEQHLKNTVTMSIALLANFVTYIL